MAEDYTLEQLLEEQKRRGLDQTTAPTQPEVQAPPHKIVPGSMEDWAVSGPDKAPTSWPGIAQKAYNWAQQHEGLLSGGMIPGAKKFTRGLMNYEAPIAYDPEHPDWDPEKRRGYKRASDVISGGLQTAAFPLLASAGPGVFSLKGLGQAGRILGRGIVGGTVAGAGARGVDASPEAQELAQMTGGLIGGASKFGDRYIPKILRYGAKRTGIPYAEEGMNVLSKFLYPEEAEGGGIGGAVKDFLGKVVGGKGKPQGPQDILATPQLDKMVLSKTLNESGYKAYLKSQGVPDDIAHSKWTHAFNEASKVWNEEAAKAAEKAAENAPPTTPTITPTEEMKQAVQNAPPVKTQMTPGFTIHPGQQPNIPEQQPFVPGRLPPRGPTAQVNPPPGPIPAENFWKAAMRLNPENMGKFVQEVMPKDLEHEGSFWGGSRATPPQVLPKVEPPPGPNLSEEMQPPKKVPTQALSPIKKAAIQDILGKEPKYVDPVKEAVKSGMGPDVDEDKEPKTTSDKIAKMWERPKSGFDHETFDSNDPKQRADFWKSHGGKGKVPSMVAFDTGASKYRIRLAQVRRGEPPTPPERLRKSGDITARVEFP